MRIRENIVPRRLRMAAKFPVDGYFVACAAKVRFAKAQNPDQAVRIRIAGTNRNRPCFLFYDVKFYDDIVAVFLPLKQPYIDVFKISRVVHALNTAAGCFFIENIAFFKAQFPHDNFVFRLVVAAKLNIFNMSF